MRATRSCWWSRTSASPRHSPIACTSSSAVRSWPRSGRTSWPRNRRCCRNTWESEDAHHSQRVRRSAIVTVVFGMPLPALLGQLTLGLVNGCFYALLSLGLAVIFGMLNIINFAHGAMYTLGAFAAWMGLQYLGLGYWPALVLAPLVVAATGVLIERVMLRKLYQLDHLYGLLLTFGLALVVEGGFRDRYGVSGLPYSIPDELSGA